jgi:uncharacterized protein (DUF2267 family)
MRYDELVKAVEQTARIDRHEADRAARATVAVLGDRLAGGEAKDLLSQLPEELHGAALAGGSGERFGIEEFYERVARAEGGGCTPDDARRHARAVMSAVKAAVSDGELEDVRAQLPAGYDDLLTSGGAVTRRCCRT